MYNVSQDFKTAMKQPVKEIQAFLNSDSVSISDSDDLISLKVSGEGGLCKTAMRKLEAQYLGEHNLLDKWVSAGFGAKLASGAFEHLNYGSFLVSELTFTKDTGVTSIVAYDKMVNAMKAYEKLDVAYPIGLYDYTAKLCEACGLEFGNDLFGYNLWDISKQEDVGNITYDSDTGIYSAEDNDARDPIIYKLQQYEGETFIEGSNVTRNLTYTGIYTFTTTRAENATRIRIANSGISREFSVYLPLPDCIAVGDTFTVSLEVIDYTVGASKFKNVMLCKGNNVQSYTPYSAMNDRQVTQELWENIDGITYRDIFTQIAQVTASTCIVGNDNKIYFKPLVVTSELLTYDNMFKLKINPIFGEINSVVLSRAPSEDNIYMRDEASIEANGLTEMKIENNEIVDKDRENAIKPIFDAIHGVSFYPFETTTEGLGWYEIGDGITITNDTGDLFHTFVFNCSVTVDGSVKETLKTTAETKTQTQYQYASKTLANRVKNTEVIVNKQDQYIKQLVSDMYEENGVVNEKYTSIYQDIESIVNSVQNSGGGNLLKNSVMFAYDSDNVPTDWTVDGDGEITMQSDVEALNSGGASGHSFTLLNKYARQTVYVKPYDEQNAVYYTFSTKIKKDTVGSCFVRLYNTNEEHIIEVPHGESVFYKDYEIKGLAPSENYYVVEFYADTDATFTDNMFAVGEYKSQWTQANGEVMNTQVNINLNGILVRSSVYAGDYTIVSPLEFAGYSMINGTPTKVFSLNKDVTEVKKLLASDEITMHPIKVVPITQGEIQGWAFVPTVKEV